jgi:hypothetical protein
MNIGNQLVRAITLWSTPKDYLYSFTYPTKKFVHQKPFDPEAKKAASELITKLKLTCPEMNVYLFGSLGLEISGQNDIDLYLVGIPNRFNYYQNKIKRLAGQPTRKKTGQIEWKFTFHGYPAELTLTSKDNSYFKEQKLLFETIRDNQKLLGDYETLKLSLDGKSQREYAVERIIFFNQILKTKKSFY